MAAGSAGLVDLAVVGWRQCATGPSASPAAVAAAAGGGLHLTWPASWAPLVHRPLAKFLLSGYTVFRSARRASRDRNSGERCPDGLMPRGYEDVSYSGRAAEIAEPEEWSRSGHAFPHVASPVSGGCRDHPAVGVSHADTPPPGSQPEWNGKGSRRVPVSAHWSLGTERGSGWQGRRYDGRRECRPSSASARGMTSLKREGNLVCFAPLFLVVRADDLYR
jgi:hypothetical protein